eukprot:753587-Hanusia_phi.AAC.6
MVGGGGRMLIFNTGKKDLPATLILLLFLGSAILVLRASQQHMNEAEAWKSLAVIVGSIFFVVLVFVVGMKVIYNYVCCFTDEYEEIESMQEEKAVFLRPDAAVDLENGARSDTNQAAGEGTKASEPDALPQAAVVQVDKLADSIRGDDEIDCGIELEATFVDYEYNGIKHSSGCLKISKVEPYGCCDVRLNSCLFTADPSHTFVLQRQAVCGVGDILVTVDGKDVHGMNPSKVQRLLRGKPGCSIVLGLYTKLSRGIIHR